MNRLLKEIDDQMTKWVQELDELYIKKADLDKTIQELDDLVINAKKITQRIKQGQFGVQRVGGMVFIPKDAVELVKKRRGTNAQH